MGMFDSIFARCPSCLLPIEFQSKSGECNLNRYTSKSVPANVAQGASGKIEICDCGVRVKLLAPPMQRVFMHAELVYDDEDDLLG